MAFLIWVFIIFCGLGIIAAAREFYIQVILPLSDPRRIARNRKLRRICRQP